MKRGYAYLLILFYMVFPIKAYSGITVDPITLEKVVIVNKENVGSVKIGNTGGKAVQIKVSPEKLNTEVADIKTWLVFETTEFFLEPGQIKEVNYKIIPPKGSSGELRCMVFFIVDEIGEERSAVGIRMGIPVYAIVSGTEVIDVKVEKINVSYDINSSILNGTILIDNKSNIHIRPFIDIKILDMSNGLDINQFSIPFGQPVQAKQVRAIMFQQDIRLNPGKYKIVASVDYGKLYTLQDMVTKVETEFLIPESNKKILEKEKMQQE